MWKSPSNTVLFTEKYLFAKDFRNLRRRVRLRSDGSGVGEKGLKRNTVDKYDKHQNLCFAGASHK